MAREIFLFRGKLDEPILDGEVPNPISRDRLMEVFDEQLQEMIRYRALGKYHFTHNDIGLDVNLPYEEMPCIRFELRKMGIDVLQKYIRLLVAELGPFTVFNPERDRIYIEEPDQEIEQFEQFLWPADYESSIEI